MYARADVSMADDPLALAEGIAHLCTDAHPYHNGWRARCPNHQGKSATSLAITPAEDRILLKCFGECATKDIVTALGLTLADLFVDRAARSLYGHSQAPERPQFLRPSAPPDARKQAALDRIRREALPLMPDDPVCTYLIQRSIILPVDDLPSTVRYHPALRYRHEDGQFTSHPAMVARVDDPHGELTTLHRTYLTLDGRKAEVPTQKKMMPPAVPGATHGGAIRLYAPGETLAVAEGIETALAVRCATGLPVWSTISAGGMARLVVPDEVRLVVICADHDAAGLDAAKALARRLLAEHRRVKMLTPDTPGADWADCQEVAHA